MAQMMAYGPVRLFYTMCDSDWQESVILRKADAYGKFVWLHYDKSIRRFNWHKDNLHMGFVELVARIRPKVQVPTKQELYPLLN